MEINKNASHFKDDWHFSLIEFYFISTWFP